MDTQIPQITWLVLIVLGIASATDLRDHQIPNLLTLPTIVIGLTFHAVSYGVDGIAFSGLGATIGLVALLPFYVTGGMGAGDVKLMAAAGSFLGPSLTIAAVCLTLVIGSGLALIVLTKRIVTNSSPSGSPTSLASTRFPYALAIALGAATAIWQSPFFDGMFDLGITL